jgi:CPA1 family monovalent cation:H+ antiporter
MLDVVAICLVITALLSWVNVRFVLLPTTIGVMVIALVLSLCAIGLDSLGWVTTLRSHEASLLGSVDFSDVLLEGMLSLLLFAGALHVDISRLRERWPVVALAVGGVVVSTAMVGFALWAAMPWIGLELDLLHCLLFGALISPTDAHHAFDFFAMT